MRRSFLFMLIVGFFATPALSGADAPISVTVRPAVTTFHGSARLNVLVARNDMNRELTWEVDGPNYYRRSSMELNGASAPRSYVFTVRDLPAGEYEVRATLRRNDRSELVDRGTIRVVGGPESE